MSVELMTEQPCLEDIVSKLSRTIILFRKAMNEKRYEKKVKTITQVVEAEGVHIARSCCGTLKILITKS